MDTSAHYGSYNPQLIITGKANFSLEGNTLNLLIETVQYHTRGQIPISSKEVFPDKPDDVEEFIDFLRNDSR